MNNKLPYPSVILQFEKKLRDYFNIKHCIATCNATISILGVFKSLNLNDSEIITTAKIWEGALTPLFWLNNNLKYACLDKNNNIDPKKIEKLISAKTKAIFTTDYNSTPSRLDEIKQVCEKYNLLLIHDAAKSFGINYKGKFSGFYADIAIFSFNMHKTFTTGEGGCVITNDTKIYLSLVKNMLHPKRQETILDEGEINPFFLNCSINLLAAEYGLEHLKRKAIIFKEKTLNLKCISKQGKKGTSLRNLTVMNIRLTKNDPDYERTQGLRKYRVLKYNVKVLCWIGVITLPLFGFGLIFLISAVFTNVKANMLKHKYEE